MTRPYLWIQAMCRRWLAARAGAGLEPAPPLPMDTDDWAAIARLGYVHGIQPLLHRALTGQPHEEDRIPDTLRARWEAAYYGNRIRNEEALTLLARLSERCRADGVDILSLKGPSAMAAVYGDIGLRLMADLDVLCRRDQVAAVTRAARAINFTGGAITPHHVALEYGAGGGLLEVHYTMHDVVQNRNQFLASAWRGRRAATVEEWSLAVMPLEHQIVFDVAHAEHHFFEMDLKHAVDLAGRLLLHRDTIDWDTLRQLLAGTGLTRSFWLLAGTLERALNLPLGMPAGAALDGQARAAFERRLVEWWMAPDVTARRSLAAGVRRHTSLLGQATYAARRLWPPLVTVQAAYDLPTRAHAALYLPRHAAGLLVDLAKRWRRDSGTYTAGA